jgi:thioredoxin-like negative regulator of GroEL
MDSPLDRKTFVVGLFIAVLTILVGLYILSAQKATTVSTPAPRAVPHEPPLAASPFIKDIKTDAEAVLSLEKGPAVVLLHTPWCGHCRNMMPAFVEAASQGSQVKWSRIDGNIAPSLVKRPDIRGFPTVFGIDSNGVVTQMNGARDVQSLLNFANAQVKEAPAVPEPEAAPETANEEKD